MLKTVLSNLVRPARTLAPADLPPIPQPYRGTLRHQAVLCTGCGTCAHVCSPKAIRLEATTTRIIWRFDAGRCSFCGLCQQFCPTTAVRFDQQAPVVGGETAAHRLESVIAFVPCPRCGKTHIPLPEETSATLPGVTAAEARLCPDCRRLAASERIRDGFKPVTRTAAHDQ
jgi:hydrogenase-4 component H